MSGSPAAPMAEAPAPAASEGPEAGRWIDAFPWIDDVCQGRVTGPRAAERAGQLVKWQAERPAEGPESARLERVAVLGGIAIEFMPAWPLGRLVPGLPGTASVDHMGMNTRARNVLFRARYETAADLALVTIGQLAELRTVGRDTVAVAVRALIGAAALSLFADGPPAHEETAAILGLTCGRIGQLLVATRDDLVADLDRDGLFTTITGQVRKRIGITGGGRARDFEGVRDHAIFRVFTEGRRCTEVAQMEVDDLSADLIARPFARVVALKDAALTVKCGRGNIY